MIGAIGTILANAVLMADGVKKHKENKDSIKIAKKYNSPTYVDARGNTRLVDSRRKVFESLNANGDLQIEDIKTGKILSITKSAYSKSANPDAFKLSTRKEDNKRNLREAKENNKPYYVHTDSIITHKINENGVRVIDQFLEEEETRRTADNIAVFFRKEMVFTKYGSLFIGYNENGTDENGKIYMLELDRKSHNCEATRSWYNFYCKAVEYNIKMLEGGVKPDEYYLINPTEAEWFNEMKVNEILYFHKEIIITERLSFEEFKDKYINYVEQVLDSASYDHTYGGSGRHDERVEMPTCAISKWAWETTMYPFPYREKHKEEIKKIIIDEWQCALETDKE